MVDTASYSDSDEFYVQDIAFRSGVVPHQTPLVMATAAAMGGFSPPAVDGSFVYCDLGCGDGTTLCTLASVNARARFLGVDFNAGHIQEGRKTARELGLTNVTFIHSGFEDLHEHDLPMFDFVAMNGIYAWLEKKPLTGVWDFLQKRLRSGGLFYVEYTTLPGMAAVPPLWKLIQTLVPAGSMSSRERAEKGLAMLEILAKRGMAYLAANQRAAQAARFYVSGIKKDPDLVDHFIHNAMASGFRPRYFQEMNREMNGIGLVFAGRTELGLNDVELAVPPAQVPTFRDIREPVMRQTLLDYIRNEQNRRDVFIKEAAADPEGAGVFLLEKLRLLGRNSPDDMQRTIPVMGRHQVGMRGPLYDSLFPAFEQGPVPAGSVHTPEAPGQRLFKAVARLISSGQFFLCLYRPPKLSQQESIEHPVVTPAVNAWLLSRAARDLRGVCLVSELTGGSAMVFSPVEVLLLSLAAEHGFSSSVQMALKTLEGETRELPTLHGRIPASRIKREDLQAVLEKLKGRKMTNMVRLGIVQQPVSFP